MFLASTDTSQFETVSLAIVDRWHAFVAQGNELALQLGFDSESGEVNVQLYDKAMREVTATSNSDVRRWPMLFGEQYHIRLFGSNPHVSVAMTTANSMAAAAAERSDVSADLNGDGEVNFADFLRLANNLRSKDATWEDGDLTTDRTVDFADLAVLAEQFGRRVDEHDLLQRQTSTFMRSTSIRQ